MLILSFPVAPHDTFDHALLRLVRKALRMSDISAEKAALYLEMDKGQLSRQLHGDGHLSLKRLTKLPAIFWSWYGLLIAEEYGLPREVRRAVRVTLSAAARRRGRADEKRSA